MAAVIIPAFPSLRSFNNFWDNSMDIRAEMNRLWTEMESAKSNKEEKTPVAVSANQAFQVSVQVDGFKPEELSVKVVGDSLVIEGQHEEKENDNSFLHKKMVRRFVLPKSADLESLSSSLSSDGILTVSASKKAIESAVPERQVTIQQAQTANLAKVSV